MKEKLIKKSEGKHLNVLGDNQIIKLTGKDTNGQFTLITQDNPPGIQIPKHIHTKEDEIFQVIEGEIEVEVGDQIVNLKDGDMIFLPRNIPHSFKVTGTKNAKVHVSIFPSGIENMFEELSQLPAGPPDFPRVAEICGKYKIHFV